MAAQNGRPDLQELTSQMLQGFSSQYGTVSARDAVKGGDRELLLQRTRIRRIRSRMELNVGIVTRRVTTR